MSVIIIKTMRTLKYITPWLLIPIIVFAIPQKPVILTTHNLPPYGSYPEGAPTKEWADSTFSGHAIDVVRCVFDSLHTPLSIHVVPWKRAQKLVKTNKADGFFAASQKDSRDSFATMSAIIADQYWNWYLLKDNPLVPSHSIFKKEATVGGFLGANMLKWMESNGYNVQVRTRDTKGLLKVLLARRVDAVMANNLVMQELLKKENTKHKIKSYVNKHKPLGVYFSNTFLKKNPNFLETFNRYVPFCRDSQK